MYRQQKFSRYATDPWYGRIFARLKPEELKGAYEFIAAHNELSQWDFEQAVNRMYLDGAREQTRNWKCVMELLTCCNLGYSVAAGGPNPLQSAIDGPRRAIGE